MILHGVNTHPRDTHTADVEEIAEIVRTRRSWVEHYSGASPRAKPTICNPNWNELIGSKP